jgi:hypothetical protein
MALSRMVPMNLLCECVLTWVSVLGADVPKPATLQVLENNTPDHLQRVIDAVEVSLCSGVTDWRREAAAAILVEHEDRTLLSADAEIAENRARDVMVLLGFVCHAGISASNLASTPQPPHRQPAMPPPRE